MNPETTRSIPPRRRRRTRRGRPDHDRPAGHTPVRHHAPRQLAQYDPTPIRFDSLPLAPTLLQAVAERGFETTTPVQSAVIPIALEGHDVIGCAATGTGKTAAFLLPILHRLLHDPASAGKGTRVLILSPTRELAVQIEDDVQGFIYHTNLTSVAVYGGVGMDAQERALKAGVDIVVATPGRLMDHMRNSAAALDSIDVLVLDEADRMMDMGFWPDVQRIVAALPPVDARQTLLFSATMPDEMMRLAQAIVRDARYVQIGMTSGAPAESITHAVQTVATSEKTEWLARFLKRTHGPVLVFVRTKHGAERLARRLVAFGLKTAALHADRTQSQRTAAIEGFKSGRYHVLVATDVAARGLDVDGITHVVNYEVPTTREAYVHRVGRTGRADMTGTALTLAAPEERRALLALEKSVGLQLQCP